MTKSHDHPQPEDPVSGMRKRLRKDLAAAMRARNRVETAVLRTLLAEIDSAQAVPVGNIHDKYVVRKFGEDCVEVARRTLKQEELQTVLTRERDARLAMADQIEALGGSEQADALRAEAEIANRYVNGSSSSS